MQKRAQLGLILSILFALLMVLFCIFVFSSEVYAAEEYYVNLNSNYEIVEIDPNGNTTFQLLASTTNPNASLMYTTSDSSIVNVDDNGLVYIVGRGVAEVYCIDQDSGEYDSCSFVSVDCQIESGSNLYKVLVDNNQYFYIAAAGDTALSKIAQEIKLLANVDYNVVFRKTSGEEIQINRTISSCVDSNNTVCMNYKHRIVKEEGNITFDISSIEAEYGTYVSIYDIEIEEGYEIGKIEVFSPSDNTIDISQSNKYFIMPAEDVVVSINISKIVVDLDGYDAYISSKEGLNVNASVSIEKVSSNNFKQIAIPEGKEFAVAYKINLQNVLEQSEMIVSVKVPQEMQSKDGIVIATIENGQYVEKAITIKDGYMSFTVSQSGDFLVLSKYHNPGRDLSVALIWIIVFNALCSIALIILAFAYVDCKQNPVANRKRVYSSIMPILALLAVSSITAVNSGYVFLIVLFSLTLLIKVIAILWLIIKLIEKGVIWSKD